MHFILPFVIGAITGGVSLYFILRNNPQKAATVNSAVNTVSAEIKKL